MANKADIFHNNDFSQFTTSILDVVHNAVEKFWEQDVKIKLRAINNFRELRDEKLVSGVDFFTSQIKVENHKPIIIRLDSLFVENFFEIALNDNPDSTPQGDFKLSSISKLEIRILNSFCEFLYKKIKEILIPVATVKLSDKSEPKFNFLFYIGLSNSLGSYILVSIPQDRVELKELKKTQSFTDEDFISQCTFVKVRIGNSKITLSELKNLEPEDIIVLDDSDIKKATLVSGDFEKKFNVKPDNSLVLNLGSEEESDNNIENEQQDSSNYEGIMEKNLWDDIQVEISAEFAKVRMSIGELKQITKGQIVDLGSVFENELSLYVENKKVAKGELVIINDKYAVRLTEVMNSAVKKEISQKPQTQKPEPKEQQETQQAPGEPQVEQTQAQEEIDETQQGQDEEFDYSDFEK